MQIVTASAARANLSRIMVQAAQSHEPITIRQARPRGFIVRR